MRHHSVWSGNHGLKTPKLYLQLWPGLTVQLVNKYLPNSVATEKGHIYQSRKIYSPKILYTKRTYRTHQQKKLDISLTYHFRHINDGNTREDI